MYIILKHGAKGASLTVVFVLSRLLIEGAPISSGVTFLQPTLTVFHQINSYRRAKPLLIKFALPLGYPQA